MAKTLLIAFALAAAALAPAGAAAQETGDTAVVTSLDATASELVEVDWVEELVQGGVTMVFLGLLSVGLLAFAAERVVMLRRSRFAPPGLAQRVKPLFLQKQYDAILAECKKRPSTLSRVIAYMVHHRKADPQLITTSAGDLGARELADQEARNVPFAVIAALAPLLGLLGTMIGMIEAFKLVEVFGDEGGASMLAGSISKALITTAVGLILAIPAIACYHWFKHRVHQITQALEQEVEDLFSAWFVGPDADAARATRRVKPAETRQPTAKTGVATSGGPSASTPRPAPTPKPAGG